MSKPKFLFYASTFVPRKFGKWPYQLALQTLQLGLRSQDLKVWARHSFLAHHFKPLVSDLDLTFWLEQEWSRAHREKSLRAFHLAKRLFPFFGEVNIYSRSDIDLLRRYFNPFELNRDPRLEAYLGHGTRPRSAGAKIAFLLRLLESDAHHLSSQAPARAPKWRAHYMTLGLPFPEPLTISSVLTTIVDLIEIDAEEKKTAKSSLESYFSHLVSGEDSKTFTPDLNHRLFFPHRFCYVSEPFDRNRAGPALGSERVLEIMLEQICWEIAGLCGQYRNDGGPEVESERLLNHLNRLAQLTNLAPLDARHKYFLVEGLSELSSKIRVETSQ